MQRPSERLISHYAVFFALYIVYASVAAVVAEHGNERHHAALISVALAVVEICAAIGFACRPSRCASGTVLLLVFATAAALTALGGEFPARLMFYAATTLFVMLLDRESGSETARI